MSRPRLRLASVNTAPAVGPMAVAPPTPKVPTLKPLLSSAAQRTEAEGRPFYRTEPLSPDQIPATYRTLTAFPRRVERSAWAIIPSLVGCALFLAIVGAVVGAMQ